MKKSSKKSTQKKSGNGKTPKSLQSVIVDLLDSQPGKAFSINQITKKIGLKKRDDIKAATRIFKELEEAEQIKQLSQGNYTSNRKGDTITGIVDHVSSRFAYVLIGEDRPDVYVRAEDLKSAVRRYQDMLGSVNPRRDAIWLPQDSTTVDESAVLPLVLREAWSQNLVVFSSNVMHVRRGVLFSLYPDNAELGRSLAGAALSAQQSSSAPSRGIQALKQVLTAVNTRTAEHLGVDLRISQQRIHLALPEQ